ncbi:MAG: DUF1361 domain-containing protein [Bacteroidia bacterium]|nr:DUF1361 domain-containing protein [Bacteroidia bacterium]
MKWLLLVRSGIEWRWSLVKKYFIVGLIGLALVLLRQFIPTDKPLLFLMWNLFLAIVPLGLSTLLLQLQKGKYALYSHVFLGILWLLFFPNAPYMMTDYIHLTYGDQSYFLLDLMTLSYFALCAFISAVLSLKDIEEYLLKYIGIELIRLVVLILCILGGIGIYLGRDLRFNSWDVILKPKELVSVSIERMSDPISDIYTWAAATIISFILFGAYVIWPKKWVAK